MTQAAVKPRGIPRDWQRKKLKYVASLRSGESITSADIADSGDYPVFGGNGIRGYTSAYTHCGRYVLIGRQGALCGNVNYAEGCFWASEHAIVATVGAGVDVTWLGELLRSMDLNQYSQSAAQPGLAVDVIANLEIPVPPPQQQLAIARYLHRETAHVDALVNSKVHVLGLLAEKRRALISRAVTSGLDSRIPVRESRIPWLGQIPAHWDVKRIKYIFKLVADPAPEDNELELLSLYTDIGVRPRRELEARGNKSTTTDSYWLVRRGDLIVNKLLAWMGAFGVSDYDGVTSPAYDVLRSIADIEPYYYHHLFRCGIYLPEIRRRSYGIMDMRLRLYFDRFGDVSVPVPPADATS